MKKKKKTVEPLEPLLSSMEHGGGSVLRVAPGAHGHGHKLLHLDEGTEVYGDVVMYIADLCNRLAN